MFSGLDAEELSRLAGIGSVGSHTAGSPIFAMGDRAENLYLVDKGEVELKLPVSILGSTREISMETLTPGQAVGWSALLYHHRMTMSAVASMDCKLVSFPRSDLLAILESDPEMGWKVMTNLAGIIVRRLKLTQAMLVRQLQTSLDNGLRGSRR